MFRKSFKVKSHAQLKSSERKILKETFLNSFAKLTEDDIDAILPKKEAAFCIKILTANDITVFVYLVQRRAIAFDINGTLYPSIYLLWKYNELVVNFTTNSFVISKILNGADLMLPGVIKNPNGYGSLDKTQIASINSNSNKSPIAVGVTIALDHDLDFTQSKGKCVTVYHAYGDKLCSLEDMPVLPMPSLGLPEWLNYSIQSTNDFPPLGGNHETSDISSIVNISETPTENEDDQSFLENLELDETASMDEVLTSSFLTAIKYSKTLKLPMLTSSFYKLEVTPLYPSYKDFDIKKTSFKKVGQFLKHMEKEGVIIIKEKKKGVETLEAINYEHPKLLNFYVDVENRPTKLDENKDSIMGPSIVESYAVTNTVIPIFQEFGFQKGDRLQATDVRKYAIMYVKNHNYQNKENQRLVNLIDPSLKHLCRNENAVSWEELVEKICMAMKSCYTVSTASENMFAKGKIQPIAMLVQTRSGNRKVTLVDNLELYGIRMSEFAKECQHAVAASTSIAKVPGKKSEQLLVQGNQVLFVYNLLVNKYKIPKKYIKGLEYAPKTKK